MVPLRHPLVASGSRLRGLLVVPLAFGALWFGGASATAQNATERAIGEWAEAVRATGATVAWGRLTAAEGEDRVDLADLAITVPMANGEPVRLAVPTASIAGLSGRGADVHTLGRLTVPKLELVTVVEGAPFRIEFGDIAVADAAVPKPVERTLDPAHFFTSFWAATRDFDAAAIGRASIGRLTMKGGSPATGGATALSIDRLTVEGLARGRVELIGTGPVAMEVTVNAGTGRLDVADVEFRGVDPTAWRRLFEAREPAASSSSPIWVPTLTSARVGRTALVSKEATVAFAGLRLGERSVRVDGPALGPIADRLIADGSGVSGSEAAQFFLELFLATRNAGWTLEGVHITGPDLDHADLARLTVGAFSAQGLAELVIEGVDSVARKAILRLDRVALTDLRLPEADDLRRAVQAALVGADVDPSSVIPTFRHFSIRGFEAAEPGVPAIRLGSFTLDLDRHLRAIPTVVAMTLEHFVVPVGLADAAGRKFFADLGVEKLDFSAALRLAWAEASREIAVDRAEAAVADLGRIDLRARIVGVPATLFLRPDLAVEILPGIGLAEATATYTDASFVERILRMVARDQKTTPEKLRRLIARDAETFFAGVADPVRRRKAADAVRRFLAAPKAITATARPPTPVPLVELLAAENDPMKIIERLDVTLRPE